LSKASVTDSGNYAARATAIRETAKWIAAVFAGAGAILFSGLSFTNVSKAALTDDWLLPLILGAVPVVAAGWAVREAAAVLTSDPPNPGELVGAGATAPERGELVELLPSTVATYGSLNAFEQRLELAREDVSRARELFDDRRQDPDRLRALSDAYQVLDGLQEGVRDVVLAADFVRVRRRYAKARWHFLGAAVVAIVAAGAAGVLAGQAERDSESSSAEKPLTTPAER
jgi:hypothetical protein